MTCRAASHRLKDCRNNKGHFKEVPFIKTGALGRIRTHDPLVRSQVLYPTELRARFRFLAWPSARTKKAALDAAFSLSSYIFGMARSAGFEPTTPWFVARYSIQLSYERNREASDYTMKNKRRKALWVAETEGFEPSIPLLTVCSLSRGVPSTSRPRLLTTGPR